jgi:hypothetical protein
MCCVEMLGTLRVRGVRDWGGSVALDTVQIRDDIRKSVLIFSVLFIASCIRIDTVFLLALKFPVLKVVDDSGRYGGWECSAAAATSVLLTPLPTATGTCALVRCARDEAGVLLHSRRCFVWLSRTCQPLASLLPLSEVAGWTCGHS